MKKVEREIEYIKDQREEIKFRFDKYVQNYHHSMIWLMTGTLGFVAILISLSRNSEIWIVAVLYIMVSTYRLVMLGLNLKKINEIMKRFDKSLNKRYRQLKLNTGKLNKEIGIKNE